MNSTAKNTEEYLATLPEWQAQLLKIFRDQIHQSSGEITEEIKWGVPAFIFKSKVIFTMAAFKNHIKYNFIMNGAALDDPHKLFNNGLESAKSRSIDLAEGQTIKPENLRELITHALAKASQ
jgi:hypothetical protein